MSGQALVGRKYLVVEDEYLVASDLLMALEDEGARVYGPVSDVARAIEVLSDPSFQLDAAILDINLGGEMVFPAAELLIKQNTPFVFVSGFDRIALPETFCNVPWLSKPYESIDLITLLQSVGSSS